MHALSLFLSIKKTHNVIIESVTATRIHTSLLKDYTTVIIDASPRGKSTPAQLSMAVIRQIGHTSTVVDAGIRYNKYLKKSKYWIEETNMYLIEEANATKI